MAPAHPDALVIGSDQVLEFQGQMLSKPASRAEAANQLRAMRGKQPGGSESGNSQTHDQNLLFVYFQIVEIPSHWSFLFPYLTFKPT